MSLTQALSFAGRSPSWGAWIEILLYVSLHIAVYRRSPSWGAWIEMLHPKGLPCGSPRRSPSWGAWIEICWGGITAPPRRVAPPRGERGSKSRRRERERVRKEVAPPRGERGSKFMLAACRLHPPSRRSPSWGAWIEITLGRIIGAV